MLAVFALAVALQATAPSNQGSRNLVVTVEGVKGDAGLVRLDLCDAADFLSERCATSKAVAARDGGVTVTFTDVPSGEYAIQAWHDRNSNGKVDRNALGVPTEPFGFSRAPPLGLSGPRFVKASFTHAAEPQAITVRLRSIF